MQSIRPLGQAAGHQSSRTWQFHVTLRDDDRDDESPTGQDAEPGPDSDAHRAAPQRH